MISTDSMFAPAGVPCWSDADLRPYADVAVRRPAVAARAAFPGTGLPVARLRNVVTGNPRGASGVQFPTRNQHQHDGTTLGSRPASRPAS